MSFKIFIAERVPKKKKRKKNKKGNNNSDCRIVQMYKKNVKKTLIPVGEINLTEKRQSSITEFTSPIKM